MKKLLVSAAVATAILSGTPALAQKGAAPAAGTINGIGYANIDAAERLSNAFKTAESQRPVTYKAQIDAAQTRQGQLQAQLKPLVDKFNADRAAATPNQAALQQQAQTIQQIQQNGQAELQRILQPVAYSQAYVSEQIEGKLQQAVDTAMRKRGMTLLLKPDALLQATGTGYNLTQDIVNELNVLIPSAQLVPPAGWEPREIREAKAQQAAQSGQAAPAAPAAPGQPSRN